MIFDSTYEAYKWFRRYEIYTDADFDFNTEGYWLQTQDKLNMKMGDWFLFRHVKDGSLISRPILGLFVGHTIWDQALVIEYVEQKRAWGWSHEVITNKELNYSMHINQLDQEVDHVQFWTDDIKVLGHWKSKPTRAELRAALEKMRK